MFYKAAEEIEADCLEQGDVLQRTDDLVALLSDYHPYYARHAHYRQFAVLTQSCDLVRRQGGKASARYLAIAPIRPLSTVLAREYEGKIENLGVGRQPYAGQRARSAIEQFLARLFNNNESHYFYYRANNGIGITEDSCAILALSVALRPEHYDKLLASRVGSIADVFQAKFGWLIGQMYSRVGTPDVSPAEIAAKTKNYLSGVAVWLEESEFTALRPAVQRFHAENPDLALDSQALDALVRALPKRKTKVIQAVLKVLSAEGLVGDDESRRRLQQRLDLDPSLAAAMK